MQSHQYANLFPMMTEAELNTLVEDMKANGVSIIYTGDSALGEIR